MTSRGRNLPVSILITHKIVMGYIVDDKITRPILPKPKAMPMVDCAAVTERKRMWYVYVSSACSNSSHPM